MSAQPLCVFWRWQEEEGEGVKTKTVWQRKESVYPKGHSKFQTFPSKLFSRFGAGVRVRFCVRRFNY